MSRKRDIRVENRDMADRDVGWRQRSAPQNVDSTNASRGIKEQLLVVKEQPLMVQVGSFFSKHQITTRSSSLLAQISNFRFSYISIKGEGSFQSEFA